MDNPTTDLTKFGYRELDMAADLLKAYSSGKSDTSFLGDGVNVWFNANSGKVFLSDEDFNVGVLEQDDDPVLARIVQFYSCPNCGNEGTQSEGKENGWDFEKYNGHCTEECEKA